MKRSRGLWALIFLLSACTSTRARTAPDLPVVAIPHLEERALLLLLVDRQIYDDFTYG